MVADTVGFQRPRRTVGGRLGRALQDFAKELQRVVGGTEITEDDLCLSVVFLNGFVARLVEPPIGLWQRIAAHRLQPAGIIRLIADGKTMDVVFIPCRYLRDIVLKIIYRPFRVLASE